MLKAIANRLDPLLVARLGRYERANTATLKSLVRPGMTCWDVGANIGQMTYILSRLVTHTGRVVAVEPSPRSVARLTRNIGKSATIIEAAISDATGQALLSGDGRSDAKVVPDGPLPVRTITLDHLLESQQHTPALIKMDIEGHELAAFRGATHLLKTVRPVLAVEFHGAGLPEHDIDAEARRLVARFGYQWRTTTPGGWYVADPIA